MNQYELRPNSVKQELATDNALYPTPSQQVPSNVGVHDHSRPRTISLSHFPDNLKEAVRKNVLYQKQKKRAERQRETATTQNSRKQGGDHEITYVQKANPRLTSGGSAFVGQTRTLKKHEMQREHNCEVAEVCTIPNHGVSLVFHIARNGIVQKNSQA